MINALDLQGLRDRFRNAKPFPYVVIDDFLEPAAAERVAKAYPSFDEAMREGFAFNFVNEQRKIQITDPRKFPKPLLELNEAISSAKFLSDLEVVTGIPRLLADEQLAGGGMHLTGSGGRLDVHVDFNVLEKRKLFRRLNILIYLNPIWQESWGGHIELWDRDVKTCLERCVPALNRCLIFETSETSYHGVAPITAPPEMVRQSFAAYYYTRETPPYWKGTAHSTKFRARPNEKFRGLVSMPVERLRRGIHEGLIKAKGAVKTIIGRK